MTSMKGFGLIGIIIALAIVAALGGGYVSMHPEVLANFNMDAMQHATTTDDGVQTAPGDHPEVDHAANDGISASVLTRADIHWKFDAAGEKDGMPQTRVSVQVGEKVHDMGTFNGSCETSSGVDSSLLAGELSRAICWFAGGGNEIGVFANEAGGYDIMVGELDEGTAEGPGFRGNFKVKASVSL